MFKLNIITISLFIKDKQLLKYLLLFLSFKDIANLRQTCKWFRCLDDMGSFRMVIQPTMTYWLNPVGKKHGSVRYTDKNLVQIYDRGQLVRTTKYYSDRNIKSIIEPNRKMSFYPNKTIKRIINQTYLKYYPNGDIMIECPWKKYLDGWYRKYHPNGRIWYYCFYRMGLLDGILLSFYPSGCLDCYAEYDMGNIKSKRLFDEKGEEETL